MKNKTLILAMILVFLMTGAIGAYADTPYKYEQMETSLINFGDKPWEKEMKKDMEDHVESIKKDCIKSQEKYEKKVAEEKRKKEEARKKAEEAKRLAEQKKAEASKPEKSHKAEKLDIVVDEDGTKWESLGSKWITHYCPACNSPRNSYASSSGKRLKEGMVACSWLPIGTVIKIDGEVYKVMDRCGTSAIDIFRDTPDGCSCSRAGSYNAKVYVNYPR